MRKGMPITDILPARKGPKYGGTPVSETPAPIPADVLVLAESAGTEILHQGPRLTPARMREVIARAILADRAAQAERAPAVSHDDLVALLVEVRRPSASPENHLRQIGDRLDRLISFIEPGARP